MFPRLIAHQVVCDVGELASMSRFDDALAKAMREIHQIIERASVLAAVKLDVNDRGSAQDLAERSDDRNFRSLGVDFDHVEPLDSYAPHKCSGVAQPKVLRARVGIRVPCPRAPHCLAWRVT